MWSFLASKTRLSAAYRSSWSIAAFCGLALLLLHQPATAQDDSDIVDAIVAIGTDSVREPCWRTPVGWSAGDFAEMMTLAPAGNILAEYSFGLSVNPSLEQQSYDCAGDFGSRPVSVGRSCIFQSAPGDSFLEGRDPALKAIRSYIIYEDGVSIEPIEGLLLTEDGFQTFEVIIPDMTDPYREEGSLVPFTLFGCGSDPDLDRDLFMTACQTVIELTTLDPEFKPGFGLCESIEEIPEMGP